MKFRGLFKVLIYVTIVTGLLSSCQNDVEEPHDPVEQFEIDTEIIENYIADNNIEATNVIYDGNETGIYVSITDSSYSDEYPTINSTVEVKYRGYYVDGTVFDESIDESITFGLSNVIVGWRIGFTAIAKGDKATILIPSLYGYGSGGRGAIPPNTVLIFDVELIDIPSNNVDE